MEIGSLANFCPLPSPPVIWPPELAARKRGLERYQAMSFDGLEGRRWLHGRKSKKKKNRRGLALHQSGTTVTVVRPHRRRRKRQQGVTRKIKGGGDRCIHTHHCGPCRTSLSPRSRQKQAGGQVSHRRAFETVDLSIAEEGSWGKVP